MFVSLSELLHSMHWFAFWKTPPNAASRMKAKNLHPEAKFRTESSNHPRKKQTTQFPLVGGITVSSIHDVSSEVSHKKHGKRHLGIDGLAVAWKTDPVWVASVNSKLSSKLDQSPEIIEAEHYQPSIAGWLLGFHQHPRTMGSSWNPSLLTRDYQQTEVNWTSFRFPKNFTRKLLPITHVSKSEHPKHSTNWFRAVGMIIIYGRFPYSFPWSAKIPI